MGVSYNVYIGPYIKCLDHKSELVEETTWCPQCKKDMKSQFCPRCGTAQATRQYTVTDWAVDEDRLYQAFEAAGMEFYDNICHLDIDGSKAGESFYTSNVEDSPGFGFDPKQEFGVIASEVDSEQDVARFEEFCGPALAVLRSVYGEDKVTVEWGVISYAN